MKAAVSEAIAEEEIQNAIALGLFDDGFRLERWKYPILIADVASVKQPLRFLLRFDFTDYDEYAVQLRLIDGDGAEIFSPFPLRNGGVFPDHQPAALPQFFCINGTRDYYTHQGHIPRVSGETWEAHRAPLPARAVIAEVRRKFTSGEWT